MEQLSVDMLAVSIAAFLYMVINFVWYSAWLFGPTWMKLAGVSSADLKKKRLSLVSSFLVAFVIAYFLAFFEGYLGVTTVSDGMFVGFSIWLGFVATTQLSSVIWEGRPIQLFFIDSGAKLLAILVMSGLIGA